MKKYKATFLIDNSNTFIELSLLSDDTSEKVSDVCERLERNFDATYLYKEEIEND